MTPEERAHHQRLTREIGDRAYLIWRSPWRLIRNRRLRREIAALLDADTCLPRDPHDCTAPVPGGGHRSDCCHLPGPHENHIVPP